MTMTATKEPVAEKTVIDWAKLVEVYRGTGEKSYPAHVYESATAARAVGFHDPHLSAYVIHFPDGGGLLMSGGSMLTGWRVRNVAPSPAPDYSTGVTPGGLKVEFWNIWIRPSAPGCYAVVNGTPIEVRSNCSLHEDGSQFSDFSSHKIGESLVPNRWDFNGKKDAVLAAIDKYMAEHPQPPAWPVDPHDLYGDGSVTAWNSNGYERNDASAGMWLQINYVGWVYVDSVGERGQFSPHSPRNCVPRRTHNPAHTPERIRAAVEKIRAERRAKVSDTAIIVDDSDGQERAVAEPVKAFNATSRPIHPIVRRKTAPGETFLPVYVAATGIGIVFGFSPGGRADGAHYGWDELGKDWEYSPHGGSSWSPCQSAGVRS